MPFAPKFNRTEIAGSLGDLGTLLPIAMGLILVSGLDPMGVFLSVGLYYLLSGFYFGVPVPVQPMKVVGAYAIVMGLTAQQIMASGLLMGGILLVLGITNLITVIGRYIPGSVVRGVQLSTGAILMMQGLKMILGTSRFQEIQHLAEPYLTLHAMGPIPIGVIIGAAGALLTLLLLDNRRFPAGLVVVLFGLAIGTVWGTYEGLSAKTVGFHIPRIFAFELPTLPDFFLVMILLVPPQLPMTVGNAVVAYVDLSKKYFGNQSFRVTHRSSAISMALANLLSFALGGMPLCHGAGGLAAHYRFGARTFGSNIVVGSLFVFLALLFGADLMGVVYLIPLAILGVLLVFAGIQLAMTIRDLKERNDLFVGIAMLGITLVSSLALGFGIGLALAYLFKLKRIGV